MKKGATHPKYFVVQYVSMLWGRIRLAAKVAVGGTAGAMFTQMWYVRHKFRLAPDACGPIEGVEQPKDGSKNASGSRKHIVFLGDSLVTGVGCSAEASKEHGHILPRRVASLVAQQLQAEVSWKLIGETGADVRTLQSNLLPSLGREVERVSRENRHVDAVIVMTGLNDIKACFLWANPGMHPWAFGKMMTTLLCSIYDVAGARCSLLVTGCPIEAVPRFNELWPLSSAVHAVTWMWENQKRVAAELANSREVGPHASIQFLEAPPSMVRKLLDGADYFAADGMHPNDAGYTVWGELIAERLLAEWASETQVGHRVKGG